MNAPARSAALDDPRKPRGGRSLVAGFATPAPSDLTISQWLDHTAAAHPAREACVFVAEGRRWTWPALRDDADRLAAGLLRLGFARGDRLGI